MLKRLLRKLKSLFTPAPKKAKYGDRVGNVVITTEAQLIKHTAYKVGESYRLGQAIVTLHANKESMLAAIAATDAQRVVKEASLTEKAIDIMMMTPDQLKQFQVEQWLEAGRGKHQILRGSRVWSSVKGLFRRTDHKEAATAPDGSNPNYKQDLGEAFKAITKIEDSPAKVAEAAVEKA